MARRPGRRHGDPPGSPGQGHLQVAHAARPRGAARRGGRLRLQHAERPEPSRLPQDGLAAGRAADAVDPARGAPALPRIARGRAPAGYWGEPQHGRSGRLPRPSPTIDAVDDAPEASSDVGDDRIRTARSPDYLRWRYPPHTWATASSRWATTSPKAPRCFRLRRRGASLEATVGEFSSRATSRRPVAPCCGRSPDGPARTTSSCWARPSATVSCRSSGRARPSVWRDVRHTEMPAADAWALSMGDVELF